MDLKESKFFRAIHADIIRGYSPVFFDNKTLYIKHFSFLDQVSLDECYDKNYKMAVDKGLPTEEEKLQWLSKEGQWTDKDQKELNDLEVYLKGLINTKKTLYLQSQIKSINSQIEEETKKYNKKANEKADLIGTTAESFSQRKTNQLFICQSLFHDKNYTKLYFKEDINGDIDAEEFFKIEMLCINAINRFSQTNIKKISLSPFFISYFRLANDKIDSYYGKPIVELTNYQVDLFSWGSYFASLLSNSEHKPSESILEDPEALIDWFTGNRNAKGVIDKLDQNKATSIVGATKEDLKAMGLLNPASVDLFEAAKGKKSLSMQDLMKLQGV